MGNKSNNIIELFKKVEKLNKDEFKKINNAIDNIIKYKYTDEDIISRTFDRLLSIVFINELDIKKLYYRLLNYIKKFNQELSDDYEKIFIDQFGENKTKKLVK